jgi:hypothetical protein
MSSIDEQFVEFVVKSLVNKPESVKVERRIDEKGVLLELTVDPEDLGRVIGKRGATAQSIRTLLRALGTKNDARYNLKIIDNGIGDRSPSRSYSDNDSPVNEHSYQQLSGDQTSDDQDDQQEEQEEPSEDRLSKTRKELEELDDLDV